MKFSDPHHFHDYHQKLFVVFSEGQSYQIAQDLTFLCYVAYCKAARMTGGETASYMQLSEAGFYERLATIRSRLKQHERKWLTSLLAFFRSGGEFSRKEIESKVDSPLEGTPPWWRSSAIVKMALHLGLFVRSRTSGRLERKGCLLQRIIDQLALSFEEGADIDPQKLREWLDGEMGKTVGTDVVEACRQLAIDTGYFLPGKDGAIRRSDVSFSYHYHSVEKRSIEFLGSPGVETPARGSFRLNHEEFNKLKNLLDSRDQSHFPGYALLKRLDSESSLQLGHDGSSSNYGFLIVIHHADTGKSHYSYPNAALIAALNNFHPSSCFARPVTGTLTADRMDTFRDAFPGIVETHLQQIQKAQERSAESGEPLGEYLIHFSFGRLA